MLKSISLGRQSLNKLRHQNMNIQINPVAHEQPTAAMRLLNSVGEANPLLRRLLEQIAG